MEAEYENSDDRLDYLDPPTTNNDFGLDPPPATPSTHGNDSILNNNNNDTHNDNYIIMENENDPDNYNIHDDDNPQLDPQLDNTNEQLHPSPLPDPTVKANNVRHSTRICIKPQRIIPYLNVQKSYDNTATTTIPEQDYVDLVGPDYQLYCNYTLVVHHVITQFSMKSDLNKFKESGEKALTTELSQLHFHDTSEIVYPKKFNLQEYDQILESHLLLK